jgi:hypothetical protein
MIAYLLQEKKRNNKQKTNFKKEKKKIKDVCLIASSRAVDPQLSDALTHRAKAYYSRLKAKCVPCSLGRSHLVTSWILTWLTHVEFVSNTLSFMATH